MALEIKPSIADKLPMTVKSVLAKMETEDQINFQDEFQRKSKSAGLMLFLAIFFPIQHFILGKFGIGLVFWFTGWGFGIWYFIEWFLASKRVREFNGDVATKILTDMKLMQC